MSDLLNSRALHYGDGIFRTMLSWQGTVQDFEAQMQTLARDAAVLALAPPSAAEVHAACTAAAQGQSGVLKLLVWRQSAGRGYTPATDASDWQVLRYPLPDYPARCWSEGVAAIRSPVTLGTQPLLAGIKHLNRLEQVLASRDWPKGVDEALMADAVGPVCGTRSNLFWVRGGMLHTPSLARAGVRGMMRDQLLALAAREKIPVQLTDPHWDDLMAADELFLSNSLIGVWPVRRLDTRVWAAPGPLTRRLQTALAHPFQGT